MEDAGQKHILSLAAAFKIAVAVIVVHAEAKHQAEPVPEVRGQLRIPQQAGERIAALLYGKHRVLPDGHRGEQPVAGGDEA